jgi:hypothetical protein
MKIGLDFDNKIITLETAENIGQFIKAIKKLLPNGEWKNYKLVTNTTINYSYPIYYDYNWCNYDNWKIIYDSGSMCFTNNDNVILTQSDTTSNFVGDNSSDTVKVSNQMIVDIQ